MVLIAAVTVALHLLIPGGSPPPFGVPTGSDPGNWLALAHEMMGQRVMSADVVYPPVFPGILALSMGVVDQLVGLALSSLLSRVILVLSVYWCVRALGPAYAVAGSLLVLFAGYQLEAYAWGSYPQLLASGLALLAIYLGLRYLSEGGRTRLVALVLGAGAVLFTHELISGLFVIAVLVGVLHSRWVDDDLRPGHGRRAAEVVGVALVVGALQLIPALVEAQSGVEPVLNPLDRRLASSLWLTTREAVVPWLLLGMVSLVGLAYRKWPPGWRVPVTLGSAVTLSGVIGFLVLFEQRVLLWAQLGVIVLALATLALWITRLDDRPRSKGYLSAVLVVVGFSFFGSIMVTGLYSFIEASSWYRIVDAQSLEALDTLNADSDPGDVVVASRGHNGNPVGWWVEGYAQRPTYSAMDIRYVAFPEERRQAVVANSLFSGELTDQEMTSLLAEIDARFVVLDRAGPDARWIVDARRLGMELISSSGSLVVLRPS